MKVAIVHDYLYQFGGAEKCVETWLEMYPEAKIYTSFSIPEKFSATDSKAIHQAFAENRIQTTWMQQIFNNRKFLKYQKHLFWLYPVVMSSVTIRDYDLVIISSTFCAKNVRLDNCQRILFYCYTPTRFLHNLVTETDQKTISPLLKNIIPLFTFWLKNLDLRASKYLTKQGTHWISISKYIQTLVEKVYHAQSQIIYPPVYLNEFLGLQKEVNEVEPFYLYLGRISFHKRVDIAIKACLESGRKLVVAGATAYQPEMDKLQEIVAEYVAKDPTKANLITFPGRISDAQKAELLRTTKSLIFPMKEDFGIVSIEAFAAGTPIIAYQGGGALDYVEDAVNGIFFPEQTVDSLKQAILQAESTNWNPEKIRQTSLRFSKEEFINQFRELEQKTYTPTP